MAAVDRKAMRCGRFGRALRSIRTQYSLMTAFFLLTLLAIFYIGGRIVLVHLVREAEEQVKDVGIDIARLATRNADRMRDATAAHVDAFAARLAAGSQAADVVAAAHGVSLLAHFSSDGSFRSAAQRRGDVVESLDAAAFRPYRDCIADWVKRLVAEEKGRAPVGIMRLGGVTHYVSLVRRPSAGVCLIVGAPFNMALFAAQVGETHAAYDVRVGGPRVSDVTARRREGADTRTFGLSPMLSVALSFYSGGFWEVSSEPFEAVFAVRDIAGRTVSTIAVSMPQAFARVTGSALGRLTFFVAMAGIFLIIPIFWLQGRIFLNPLSRMAEDIRYLAERHEEADCPRLEWKGRDEFAILAESVNRLLETIAARTVSLAQLKIRQRALIEGVPDALAVFDKHGRLVSLAKQPEGIDPLPGLRVDERPDGSVFGAAGLGAFASALAHVFSQGRVEHVELEDLSSPDASRRRHFEVRLTRMDECFALAIVRDVTAEHAEHQLRLAAERRALDLVKRESLTLFAAGIAHDVNNVLAVILNTVEAAAAKLGTSSDASLVAIRDAVKRGSSMTKELMTYAGEAKIALVRLNPSFVVKDVQMLAEGVIGKNIELSYDLADDVPEIDADLNQFWKVIFNIVKNAAEAIGPHPGHIVIATSRCEMTPSLATVFRSEHPLPFGPGVVIRITDDGPGVPADVLPRLFDPYVSSKSLGRGLGLATVRTIVEAHGGGIRVASEPGCGTTFHIFLPASSLPARTDEPVAVAEAVLPTDVLVVDNDEAILKTSSILLKALKVTPHVARDRHEALAYVRRQAARIGVVLLDANLGGIDTVRLLGALRHAAPNAKIVLSSGSREEDLRELFASQPFDAFLAKPYTMVELKAALARGAPKTAT